MHPGRRLTLDFSFASKVFRFDTQRGASVTTGPVVTAVQIVSILRKTLQRMEQAGTFKDNDPALIHLKRKLILAIAELEVQKDRASSTTLERPVFVLRIQKPDQPSRSRQLEYCSAEN